MSAVASTTSPTAAVTVPCYRGNLSAVAAPPQSTTRRRPWPLHQRAVLPSPSRWIRSPANSPTTAPIPVSGTANAPATLAPAVSSPANTPAASR
ncbi:hypothetical protein BHE74_00044727 [Ensete ventricosum]|nr:hypothetical protein GW17_00016757 [Ensete ventricosum]RWW49146.1 hypothetical protein BHE74_00044727 [Ensete ventricosum]